MKRLTALVIGFGPFPGAPVNPSAELVRAVGRMRRPAFGNARIVTHVLPTRYSAVEQELPELVRSHNPDVVLMFGLAGRARTLRVESLAANACSLLHPDAVRKIPPARTLIAGAPASLKTAAPLAAMIAAAKFTGVNANISHHAGRYICNAALFTCLDLRRRHGRPPLVAFVHIPWPRTRRKHATLAIRRRPAPETLLQAGAAILAALLARAKRT